MQGLERSVLGLGIGAQAQSIHSSPTRSGKLESTLNPPPRIRFFRVGVRL